MVLLEANGGPASDFFWHPSTAGDFTVSAVVDPDNGVDEILEGNNTASEVVHVSPPRPVNLALRKVVTVSSTEGTGLEGDKAVDGSVSTRWSSSFSDPQWLTVDLGASVFVDHVILRWEAAYAKEYYLQVSDNNSAFDIVYHEMAGNGGIDSISVNRDARYIKMLGIMRGTQYGYSLYELEAFGSGPTGVVEPQSAIPLAFALEQNYPNPFNPTTVIRYTVGGSRRQASGVSYVRLVVFDMLGREVNELVNQRQLPGSYEVRFDAYRLSSGVYFYRLTTSEGTATKTMSLLK